MSDGPGTDTDVKDFLPLPSLFQTDQLDNSVGLEACKSRTQSAGILHMPSQGLKSAFARYVAPLYTLL